MKLCIVLTVLQVVLHVDAALLNKELSGGEEKEKGRDDHQDRDHEGAGRPCCHVEDRDAKICQRTTP